MANAPAWRSEPPGGGYSRPSSQRAPDFPGFGQPPPGRQPIGQASSDTRSDDGWDAPTHVRSTSAPASYQPEPAYRQSGYGAPPNPERPPPSYLNRPGSGAAERSSAAVGPGSNSRGLREQSDERLDVPGAASASMADATRMDVAGVGTVGRRRSDAHAQVRASVRQRGIAGWQAVLLLIVICGIGGVIDLVRGASVKGAFNIALIVAAIVAILLVRRREMFPVLVAPPLVYFVASAGLLYVRSSGLHDRSRLLDAAINWLVYGFPAIAGATAAVLIIGGIRLVLRR